MPLFPPLFVFSRGVQPLPRCWRANVVQGRGLESQRCCCVRAILLLIAVGGGALIVTHGRYRKTEDTRIPTMPGRRTLDFC